jgi:hypothetical protein
MSAKLWTSIAEARSASCRREPRRPMSLQRGGNGSVEAAGLGGAGTPTAADVVTPGNEWFGTGRYVNGYANASERKRTAMNAGPRKPAPSGGNQTTTDGGERFHDSFANSRLGVRVSSSAPRNAPNGDKNAAGGRLLTLRLRSFTPTVRKRVVTYLNRLSIASPVHSAWHVPSSGFSNCNNNGAEAR